MNGSGFVICGFSLASPDRLTFHNPIVACIGIIVCDIVAINEIIADSFSSATALITDIREKNKNKNIACFVFVIIIKPCAKRYCFIITQTVSFYHILTFINNCLHRYYILKRISALLE